MSTVSWQEVEKVLAEILDVPDAERLPRLKTLCAGHPDLEIQVKSLLAAHESAGSFLESPVQISSSVPWSSPFAGKQLGSYRLLDLVGTGGMGAVYRAERTDGRFQKQVAIKVVPAAPHSPELLRRFTAEQQILAGLEHPNIARLMDAEVSPEGIPYFVMEYVEGIPVNEYCDVHHLSTRERLVLFQSLCSAVQYAHQHLVVHRDLKPGNILVSADGVPKLLDFGIAKILAAPTIGTLDVTRSLLNPLTPGYASPEQVRASTITTATDIYSLGVVLYEVLTGQAPYQVKGRPLDEVIRVICESEPEKPSAVVRRHVLARKSPDSPSSLSSDLDAIVAKAMSKGPNERYASAEEFSSDIGHHLANQPVEACSVTTGYRLRKYVRRHRFGVATATGFVLLLAGVAIMQAVQLGRTRRERDRANRITEFMTNMFNVSDPSEARGNSITAREILDKASKEIDSGLANDPEVQAEMMDVMGDVYRNLGLYSRAHPLLQRSADTRHRLFGPANPETLKSMNDLAATLDDEGQYAEAENLQRETLDTRRRVLGPNHLDTLASMTELSIVLRQEGRYPEAERLQRELLDTYRRLLGPNDLRRLQVTDQLGTTLTEVGQYPEAEKLRSENLDAFRRILGPDHPRTLMALSNLAGTLLHEAKYPEAEELYRETLNDHRRIFGPEHPRTIGVMDDLAETLSHQRKFAKAENLRRDTLALYRRVLGQEHPDTLISMANLAETYALEGRWAEAEKLYRETLAIQRRVLGPNNPDTATTIYNLVFVAIHRGDREKAFQLLGEALDHGLPPEYAIGIEADQELISLHGDTRFEALVARAKKLVEYEQKKP